MGGSGSPQRRSKRKAPVHTVIVSADAERASTTGQAVNLSAGGACLAVDDAAFEVGDELILKIYSAGPKWPVFATGRIVWTAPGHCGVEWTHGGPQRHWIGWLSGA
jgi:hypothetical protein